VGKRSDFKRVERDFYETPLKGVLPLIPHIPNRFTYIEPCAGAGQLMVHLKSQSKGVCIGAYDIEPQRGYIKQRDALDITSRNIIRPDFFITNPPWDRKLLHPLIEQLSDIAPTWLLFDADWVHTKQSIPFQPRLRKIVSVGRLVWIPGSKMTGKDNSAWHLFSTPSQKITRFYGALPK